MGLKRIFLPETNMLEASVIPDIDIIAVSSLRDAVEMLMGEK